MESATKADLKELLAEFRREFKQSIRQSISEAFDTWKPAIESQASGLQVAVDLFPQHVCRDKGDGVEKASPADPLDSLALMASTSAPTTTGDIIPVLVAAATSDKIVDGEAASATTAVNSVVPSDRARPVIIERGPEIVLPASSGFTTTLPATCSMGCDPDTNIGVAEVAAPACSVPDQDTVFPSMSDPVVELLRGAVAEPISMSAVVQGSSSSASILKESPEDIQSDSSGFITIVPVTCSTDCWPQQSTAERSLVSGVVPNDTPAVVHELCSAEVVTMLSPVPATTVSSVQVLSTCMPVIWSTTCLDALRLPSQAPTVQENIQHHTPWPPPYQYLSWCDSSNSRPAPWPSFADLPEGMHLTEPRPPLQESEKGIPSGLISRGIGVFELWNNPGFQFLFHDITRDSQSEFQHWSTCGLQHWNFCYDLTLFQREIAWQLDTGCVYYFQQHVAWALSIAVASIYLMQSILAVVSPHESCPGVGYSHGNVSEGWPSGYMTMVLLRFRNYSTLNSLSLYTALHCTTASVLQNSTFMNGNKRQALGSMSGVFLKCNNYIRCWCKILIHLAVANHQKVKLVELFLGDVASTRYEGSDGYCLHVTIWELIQFVWVISPGKTASSQRFSAMSIHVKELRATSIYAQQQWDNIVLVLSCGLIYLEKLCLNWKFAYFAIERPALLTPSQSVGLKNMELWCLAWSNLDNHAEQWDSAHCLFKAIKQFSSGPELHIQQVGSFSVSEGSGELSQGLANNLWRAYPLWLVAWTIDVIRAAFSDQVHISHDYYVAFINRIPADTYNYSNQAFYLDRVSTDLIYYLEDSHGDPNKSKELHVPWDPGKSSCSLGTSCFSRREGC